MSSIKPLSEGELRDIAAYARRIGELLDSCADHQRSDPEVFLWNARRALEAICLMLQTAGGVSSEKRPVNEGKVREDNSLNAMLEALRARGILDEQQYNRFTSIRSHTNLGVHIRKAEREDYPTAVEDVRALLPNAVRWVVRGSAAAPHLRQEGEELLSLADRIEANGRPLPRAAMEAALWKEKHEKARQELDEVQVQLAAAREALALTDEAARHAAPRSAAPRSAGPRSAGPTPPRTRLTGLHLFLTVCFVGFAVAVVATALVGVPRGLVAPTLPVEAALTPRAPGPTPEAATAPAAPPAAAPPASPAGPVAPDPPQCPEGMVLIRGDEVTLGQPTPRDKWPAAKPKEIAPVLVADFCVDPRPRTVAELKAWRGSAKLSQDRECDWSSRKDASAAVCVRHQDAAAYCAAAVERGRLPSVVEWELLARGAEKNLGRSAIVKEWAADTFPPAVFNREHGRCSGGACGGGLYREAVPVAQQEAFTRDSGLWWKWYNQEPQQKWTNLGFRCATSPR